MSHPHFSSTFRPARKRSFFLPEVMIQRLGGPQAAEIMKLLVETELEPSEIQKQLQLSAGDYDAFVLTHLFQRELKSQKRLRAQPIQAKPPGRPKAPTQDEPLPPSIQNFKLPKGVAPSEYALKRINEATPQAVEKLIYLMHNSRQETIQYNAATKLLGLNGIVEVEKSISVIADAEAIIRELNRRGPYKPKTQDDVVDAVVVEDTPNGRVESSGESEPSPQEFKPALDVEGQFQPCGESLTGDCG